MVPKYKDRLYSILMYKQSFYFGISGTFWGGVARKCRFLSVPFTPTYAHKLTVVNVPATAISCSRILIFVDKSSPCSYISGMAWRPHDMTSRIRELLLQRERQVKLTHMYLMRESVGA